MAFPGTNIDWRLPAAVAAVCLLGALAGQTGMDWFRFDRVAIGEGQLWRLLSGQLLHLGWQHLFLNLAGLALVWLLTGDQLSLRQWLVVLLVSFAGVAGGLWYLNTALQWYVGLSGALHGLLAAGLVPGIRGRSTEAVILGIALVAKLVFEQLAGPLPGSEAAAGGAVVVDAHLYGFVAGGIVALSFGRRVHPAAPI